MSDTDARIIEITRRLQAATAGPWESFLTDDGRCAGIRAVRAHSDPPEAIVETDSGFYGPTLPDAEFIAHARQDIPFLLQQLATLRTALEMIAGKP